MLGGVTFAWLLFMLAFRAFVYADMYKAPEDPYGISDIIEFLLYIIFIAKIGVSVLLSIILMFRGKDQTKKAALGIVVYCIVIFFSYSPLHSIVAKW